MAVLNEIETVVVVMMENRSFDHMLGYLSLPGSGYGQRIEGLRKIKGQWPAKYGNPYKGKTYFPTYSPGPRIKPDPPHDRDAVARQMNLVGAKYRLNGFVQNYMDTYEGNDDADPTSVMRYYTAQELPVFDYFARHYCVCDHWFSALPTSTHPNRLMGLCGYSEIEDNVAYPRRVLPAQTYIFDVLPKKIGWRVYNEDGDISFFNLLGLFPRFMPKGISLLEEDLQKSDFPRFIWIEPKYTYAYRIGNDDHPDASVLEGQLFLGNLYKTLRSDTQRWAKTLLIIVYDEHGGFFDHLQPPRITTTGNFNQFISTGVRVPAFMISPYVRPGVPFRQTVDHTSILKLLDDRYSLNRYPIDGRGQDVLGNLADGLAQAHNLPDPALIREAIDRISLWTQPSTYDRAYLAAAKEHAQNYVYIGPDVDGHAANRLNPRLLGVATDQERRSADESLRKQRAVLHALITPVLTYQKKQEITDMHAVTMTDLHQEIKTVVARGQLALKLKPAKIKGDGKRRTRQESRKATTKLRSTARRRRP